jgi:hypothetical protein
MTTHSFAASLLQLPVRRWRHGTAKTAIVGNMCVYIVWTSVAFGSVASGQRYPRVATLKCNNVTVLKIPYPETALPVVMYKRRHKGSDQQKLECRCFSMQTAKYLHVALQTT